MNDKTHNLFGGSSAKHWANCYGWASLVKDLPYEEPGDAAKRGTALHTGILERKVLSEINHRIDGSDVVPNTPASYRDIPDWPADGIILADEFWQLVWKEVLEEFITGKKIHIEKKLMLFPDLDSGGTADFIAMYYNDKGKFVAVLGDCKFGRTYVEPSDEQFKFYLCALNKVAKDKGKNIDIFESFVYQPEHEPVFRRHTFTKSEIERAEVKYLKAITESKKEKPKFKVGDWCTWCKAKAKCEAYTNHLDKEMELAVIRNKELGTVNFIDVATTPDEILEKIHLFKHKVEDLFSRVDKEIILRIAARTYTGDLRCVEGTTKSKFTDPEDTAMVMEAHGVNPYNEPKLVGIGDMKGRLMETKGITKKEAEAIVAPLTSKPGGPPKITTKDDPKPDYVFSDSSACIRELDSDSEF